MPDSPIRILLVDDSAMVRTILSRIFEKSEDVEVVGTAIQGKEALDMVAKLEPAVVCTDLHMPVMNGLELTKQIMQHHPRPILVISNAVNDLDQDNVFELLQAGALDVFAKPKSGAARDYERAAADLVRRIRVLAGVRVIRKGRRKIFGGASPRASIPPGAGAGKIATRAIVAIGASTGGPQAYRTVLSELPADFPVPIVCVQHIGEGFLPSMVAWLNTKCRLQVKIAKSGDTLMPGTAHFAPDGLHLEVDFNGKLVTSSTAPLDGHRPSVTALFRSVVDHFKDRAVGVLLTGMGRDGAEGMQTMAKAGAITIAQNEETCVVFGMPQRAIELGAAKHVLPLNEIPKKLIQVCPNRMNGKK